MNAISTPHFTLRTTPVKLPNFERRLLAWLPLITLPATVFSLTKNHMAPWQSMWLLSAAIYISFKWLAWQIVRHPRASFARKVAWWLAWMRMDPAEFLRSQPLPQSKQPNLAEWRYAGSNVAAGILLVLIARACVAINWPFLGGWSCMFGLVLVLHFGLFHLLSCAWRSARVNALPVMNHPLRSTGLAEFWGRRWNLAFHDTAYAALFRPLAKRHGTRVAMLAVFLFSGIIHEAGITVPGRGGYGLPTLYFLLQSGLMLIQNSKFGKRSNLARGARGRLFTLLTVFAPLPMLFPPPFVYRVIVPMLQAFA